MSSLRLLLLRVVERVSHSFSLVWAILTGECSSVLQSPAGRRLGRSGWGPAARNKVSMGLHAWVSWRTCAFLTLGLIASSGITVFLCGECMFDFINNQPWPCQHLMTSVFLLMLAGI